MNTMLTGRSRRMDLNSQINKFADNIKHSGKNPQELLDELIKSGKYTKEQLSQAEHLVRFFLKGGRA